MVYPYTRNIFNNLLNQAGVNEEDFYFEIIYLLQKNPYFFKGYLELYFYAKNNSNFTLAKNVLNQGLSSALEIYTKPSLRKFLSEFWTSDEINSLRDFLLFALQEINIFFIIKRIIIFIQLKNVDTIVDIKTNFVEKDLKYLKFIKKINTEAVESEILRLPNFLWHFKSNNYLNEGNIIFFRRNNEIIGNGHLGEKQELSSRFLFNDLFSNTISTILSLEKELNLKIEQATIVKTPYRTSLVRNFPTKVFGKKSGKYYLFLDMNDHDFVLESGDSSSKVTTGQLWWLDDSFPVRFKKKSKKIFFYIYIEVAT
jgi:hypothetical protein